MTMMTIMMMMMTMTMVMLGNDDVVVVGGGGVISPSHETRHPNSVWLEQTPSTVSKARARGCWKQNTSSSEWHVVRKSLSNTIAACTLRSHIVLQYVNRLGIYHDAVHGKWSGVSRTKVYCSSSGTAAFKRVVNSFCLALSSSLYLVWKAFLNYFAPNQHQSYY